MGGSSVIDVDRHRFPYCVVWTPLPMISWFFPIIGHMGIATSKGIIRDFGGSYYVAEDNMAFGWPSMFWQLDPDLVIGGAEAYDRAIRDASDEYKSHFHNICCDNCHSHVALALNNMQYAGKTDWNMVNLAFWILIKGRFAGNRSPTQYSTELIVKYMVRLTVDMINDAQQYINPIRERELNLRAYKVPVIENMGVTRDQFDVIDLTDNDIKRIDNFPLLKRVHTLYLHNNRVSTIQPDIGEKLPNLKTLALTNNNICELGDLDPLSSCKKLEYVTFLGNPIVHMTNYRPYIIFKMPSVRVIDFKRVKLAEREKAREIFKGKRGKKAREEIKHTKVVETGNKENETYITNKAGMALTEADKTKIKEAINNAKTLQEVEYLQSVLATGRVPEEGWNKQLDLLKESAPITDGFAPEDDDDMET